MDRDPEACDPMEEESTSKGHSGGVHERNSFWPSRESIHDGEKVHKPPGRRQWSHDVDMDVAESSVRWIKSLEWGFMVTMNLCPLTMNTRTGPVARILCHTTPNKLFAEETSSGTDPRLSKIVNDIKDCATPLFRNHGMGVPCGDVTEEGDVQSTERNIL